MKQRGFLIFLFLASMFLGGGYSARAQTPNDVDLQISAGLDGKCRQNSWMPVGVLVSNRGADLPSTDLEIRIPSYDEPSGTPITIPAALPAGARKAFSLYAYPNDNTGKVVLTFKVDGKLYRRTSTSIQCVGRDDVLIGVLGDTVPAGIMPPKSQSNATSIAFLDASNLPDQPFGLEALSALVIMPQSDTRTLRPEQVEAIRLWVLGGGNLLVIGGGHWTNALGLGELLPMQPQGSTEITALAQPETLLAAPLTISTGQAAEDASTTLYSAAQQPLFSYHIYGEGFVSYLAFDPNTLSEAGLAEKLFAASGWQVSPGSAQIIAFSLPDSEYSNIYNALHALPEHIGFPLTLVCVFLVAYLLLLGPVSFRILRKRQEWIWVSSLVLALGFTLFMLLVGTRLRGKPLFQQFTIVQTWDKSETAVVRGIGGLYSPNRVRITPQADRQMWLFPFRSDSSPLAAVKLAPQGVQLPDLSFNVSTMAHFSLAYLHPAPDYQASLQIVWREDALRLQGTLNWNEDLPLHDSTLFTENGSYFLGEIHPGINHIDLMLSGSNIFLYPPNDYPPITFRSPGITPSSNDTSRILAEQLVNRSHGQAPDHIKNQRADILAEAIRNLPFSTPQRIWIAGWQQKDSPEQPGWSLSGTPITNEGQTLYLLSVSGDITPPGTRYQLSYNIDDVNQWNYLYPGDQILLEGWLPGGRNGFNNAYMMRKCTLEITASSNVQNASLALWNYDTEAFDEFNVPTSGRVEIENPTVYFSSTGLFQIQIGNTDQNDTLHIKKMFILPEYEVSNP